MSDNKKTTDMSVEDILKSIKKVMNDDNDSSKDDILELTEVVNSVSEECYMSETTASKTAQIFDEYTDKVKGIKNNTINHKATTIEELIQPTLKALISQWLDKNLPSIVENIVTKEIQKLSSKD